MFLKTLNVLWYPRHCKWSPSEGNIEDKIENQIETVINLHNAGAEIELISQGTNLGIEEIKKIIEENGFK